MTKFFTLFVLLYLPFSFAANCPDFTGRYRNVDDSVTVQYLIIKQKDCSTLNFTFRTVNANNSLSVLNQTLVMDGQSRKMSETYSAAYIFSGSTIQELGEALLSDGSHKVIPGNWSFEDNNQTLVRNWLSTGIVIREVYKRR